MRDQSEEAFFIGKAREAEERATAATTPEERATWQNIAREYRRLSKLPPQPKERGV